MCGINGIFAYCDSASAIDRAELIRTREHMAARGPDGMGAWVADDERIALGHRRLAVIDPTGAAAQPMVSPDGRLIVTFNGSIYNYRQLRGRLETRGYVFRTRSDTEVLLHLYAQKGPAMVQDLRGMFAFAIWDTQRRSLLLARDPFGIKPLYYADDGGIFRFASQVKALLAGGAVSHDPDPAGQVGFYLLGSVPEPFTTYREIRAVPAGSTLLVDNHGAHAPRTYHAISGIYCDADAQARPVARLDRGETIAELREALLDSVRRHLVADVPVGAFLSAGIESGALLGLMRDAGQQDIQTVTIAFSEFRGRTEDEAPIAEEVARRYGARHTTRVVTKAELEADLPRLTEAMDQPSIDGINTWFASKAARELGLKAVISGLGGDQLLGGSPSFRSIPSWVRLMAAPARLPLLGKVARWAAQPLVRAMGANPKAAGMLEFGGSYAGAYLLRRGLFMPWELGQVLARETVEDGLRRLAPMQLIGSALEPRPRSSRAKVAVLETSFYLRNQLLRDTDWASMAHSLEIRVPLVDRILLRRVVAAAAVARRSWADIPQTTLALTPRTPLPDRVLSRPRTGFTVPIADWLQPRHPPAPAPSGGKISPAGWSRQWAERLAAV